MIGHGDVIVRPWGTLQVASSMGHPGLLDLVGERHAVRMVHPNEVEAWLGGTLIQWAMPSVSDNDREYLISGMTPDDWRKMDEEIDELYREEYVEDDEEGAF